MSTKAIKTIKKACSSSLLFAPKLVLIIPSMTLYIFLQGGIGNQLFQYTAAYQMAKTLGTDVRIIKAPFAHSGRDYRGLLYGRVASVEAGPAGTHVLCLQSFSPWKPEDYRREGDLILQGYFQYLPAIESVLPVVREDLLTQLALHRDAMRAKYAIDTPSSFGFLHVRRGDYLKVPHLHWIMDADYYTEALQHAPATLRWLVLSDDVLWCKGQKLFTESPNIQIADEPDELNGLALMSLCHGGAIIGNSTYSWWGAMLGAEPAGATVVFPFRWFSAEKPALFPGRWIRV